MTQPIPSKLCPSLQVMISMNVTLLVGLSIDYILHMAEGYHQSEKPDRMGRIADMLEHLGLSVLSGALTTLGAATFMLFAKIEFFFQFGTFLYCIIGFSLVFSLVVFPATLSLIGPQGNTGSISAWFKKLNRMRLGRDVTDVDCGQCAGKGFHSLGQSDCRDSETTQFTTDISNSAGSSNTCNSNVTEELLQQGTGDEIYQSSSL